MSADPAVTSDLPPFSMIPEWVLDVASDRAVHLYCRLSRYGSSDAKAAWPSRKTLAAALRCSVDSIDRTLKELVTLGAVTVTRRKASEGDNLTNYYHLHFVRNDRTPAAEGGTQDRGPGWSPPRPKREPLKENQKAKLGASRKSATPFPDGKFPITDAMTAWVKKDGYGYLDIRSETAQFKDHALANDRRTVDWVAAWRNWIRRAAKYYPPPPEEDPNAWMNRSAGDLP